MFIEPRLNEVLVRLAECHPVQAPPVLCQIHGAGEQVGSCERVDEVAECRRQLGVGRDFRGRLRDFRAWRALSDPADAIRRRGARANENGDVLASQLSLQQCDGLARLLVLNLDPLEATGLLPLTHEKVDVCAHWEVAHLIVEGGIDERAELRGCGDVDHGDHFSRALGARGFCLGSSHRRDARHEGSESEDTTQSHVFSGKERREHQTAPVGFQVPAES